MVSSRAAENMINELKTTRITCDHCGEYKDIEHFAHEPIEFTPPEANYGFKIIDAGEHNMGDGSIYQFILHFCSHECMIYQNGVKAKRIENIYREKFKHEEK